MGELHDPRFAELGTQKGHDGTVIIIDISYLDGTISFCNSTHNPEQIYTVILSAKSIFCLTIVIHVPFKSPDVHGTHDLIEQLARTVACGGNYLLNVGPDQHGKDSLMTREGLR